MSEVRCQSLGHKGDGVSMCVGLLRTYRVLIPTCSCELSSSIDVNNMGSMCALVSLSSVCFNNNDIFFSSSSGIWNETCWKLIRRDHCCRYRYTKTSIALTWVHVMTFKFMDSKTPSKNRAVYPTPYRYLWSHSLLKIYHWMRNNLNIRCLCEDDGQLVFQLH